ncbi:hypothetical protein [Paenibacillus agilis]|uniref:Uncharacterized protein n=1 Tax=Paenibacillus agilis TaxID=3020863 RepID=A0A559IKV5_9BACL|nr:hypothetical protein [Paenibacillus agilis]TVX88113.1 hypothetical protein FPZ44_19590 [Paenibacillus agilis]
MLSYEEKSAIADSFLELERRQVSLGRSNYHYEQSLYDKKTVVYHLHPNGNGFVYAGLLKGYEKDDKGLVNIRDFTADELRTIIEQSIRSLSAMPASLESDESHDSNESTEEEHWTNESNQTLTLQFEDEDQMWYIYAGLNLDTVFETYEEATEYLEEEGFKPAIKK